MKRGMSIQDLLTEVQRQSETKRDFVASTKEAIRMVPMPDFPNGVAIVLHKEGGHLSRFQVAENCHRQISGRLGIPWKYYSRLLTDHKDLVLTQVNALFEREPETRLMRTLDGTARAFLSDRYRRLDHDEVLSQVLPPIIKGDIESTLLSSNVTDNNLYLKVLFTDDSLAIDLGKAPSNRMDNGWGGNVDVNEQHQVIARRDAGQDIVRPGCLISNSETGHGSLSIKGFLFRSYCLNGCVWGMEDAFSFSRNHIGGKLVEGQDFEVFSDETKRKQDEVIIAELTDALGTMTNPDRVRAMGERLRALKSGETVQDAFAAVDALAKEVDIREGEKQGILSSLLRDQDFTQWGVLNAVTEQANSDEVSYERACEIEQLGNQIAKLNTQRWHRIATAEKVAA